MRYHSAGPLATLNRFILSIVSLVTLPLSPLGGERGNPLVSEVPGTQSAFGPSAVYFNQKVYLGWRGVGSPHSSRDDQSLSLRTLSAEGWGQPWSLSRESMFGPVLAASEERLYVAWHGEGNLFTGTGDGRLHLAYLDSLNQIHSLGEVPGAISAGPPGLAVYEGLVYVGWRSAGNITLGMVPGNQHWINYMVYDPEAEAWLDTTQKGGNIVHANGTSGPIFAVVGRSLYGLWRGTGSMTFYGPNSAPGDPSIYFGWLDHDEWSTSQLPLPTIPGASTAWSPGAVEWKEKLLVGWRGDQARGEKPEDPTLSFALYQGHERWETLELFGQSKPESAFAPAMTVDRGTGRLWVFWRGVLNSEEKIDNQQIYTASFADF